MSEYVRALLLSLSRCAHIFIVNSHLHSHNAHMFIMYICNTFFHYFIAYTNNYLIPIFITMNVTNTNSVTALFSLSFIPYVICMIEQRRSPLIWLCVRPCLIYNIYFFFRFTSFFHFFHLKKISFTFPFDCMIVSHIWIVWTRRYIVLVTDKKRLLLVNLQHCSVRFNIENIEICFYFVCTFFSLQ